MSNTYLLSVLWTMLHQMFVGIIFYCWFCITIQNKRLSDLHSLNMALFNYSFDTLRCRYAKLTAGDLIVVGGFELCATPEFEHIQTWSTEDCSERWTTVVCNSTITPHSATFGIWRSRGFEKLALDTLILGSTVQLYSRFVADLYQSWRYAKLTSRKCVKLQW